MYTERRYIEFKSQKKRADDCVIRALMKLTGNDWETCFDELCVIAKNQKRMPNEWKVVEEWLRNHNYVKYSYGRLSKGERRVSVNEFAIDNPEGSYLISVAGHVVASIDGYYYDSWDCGNCKIYTYYKLEE